MTGPRISNTSLETLKRILGMAQKPDATRVAQDPAVQTILELFRSPYADSLAQIAGKPSYAVIRNEPEYGLGGRFSVAGRKHTGPFDKEGQRQIGITPFGVSERFTSKLGSPKATLAHEYGHLLDDASRNAVPDPNAYYGWRGGFGKPITVAAVPPSSPSRVLRAASRVSHGLEERINFPDIPLPSSDTNESFANSFATAMAKLRGADYSPDMERDADPIATKRLLEMLTQKFPKP